MNICQNCGQMRDNNSPICEFCGSTINPEFIERLIPFASDAVKYGFYYRSSYEAQFEEHGQVSVKYSLLQPSNYWELLAVFAISGYVGGISFELVKYFGKQLLNFLTGKSDQSEDEKKLLEFLKDEDSLKKFAKYIIAYYKGYPLSENKEVDNAIIEEELADYASEEGIKEFDKVLEAISEGKGDEFKEFMGKVSEGVVNKRLINKPNKEEIKALFPQPKKKMKLEKDKSAKRR